MASERKFLAKAMSDWALKEFLNKELSPAGVSHIEIQKTPIATRIAIFVRRPGLVVGKKGKTIRDISEILQSTYSVENPQIEVVEVPNPSLNAKLMAEKIGKQLEIKGTAKTAMRFALREIMSAGAIGAEIKAAGKLAGKGAKAKHANVRAGYLKKSGEQAKKVDIGHFTAYLKAGAIGIVVKIVPPNTIFSDTVDLTHLISPADVSAAQESAVEEKKEEKIEKKKITAKRRAPRKKVLGEKAEAGEQAESEKTAAANEEAIEQPTSVTQPTAPAQLPEPAPAEAV